MGWLSDRRGRGLEDQGLNPLSFELGFRPMRPTSLLAAMVAVALPFGALAQGLGLDLTDEPKKEEPKKEEPKKEEATPAPLDLDKKPSGEAKLSEVDIASEDRVKSVQRKAFLKRMRVEVTPMGFLTLNDAFFPKYGPGVRAAFFLQDSFGLSLRAFQYNLVPSDNVRYAKRELQSKLYSVLPTSSFSLDALWSPVYGKVAFFNSIRTFDFYVIGGVGLLFSQTSFGDPPDGGDGPHVTTSLGAGERLAIFDWMAVDVSAVETMYSDRPGALQKSVLQHVLSVNFGVSFYLPLSFEYREP